MWAYGRGQGRVSGRCWFSSWPRFGDRAELNLMAVRERGPWEASSRRRAENCLNAKVAKGAKEREGRPLVPSSLGLEASSEKRAENSINAEDAEDAEERRGTQRNSNRLAGGCGRRSIPLRGPLYPESCSPQISCR